MSDIRNLLTAKDYSLIDMYREDYVSEDQVYHIGYGMIPSFDLLMPWSKAKSEFLTALFGNQLILSREISLRKSCRELYDDEATHKHIDHLEQLACRIRSDRLYMLCANHIITDDEFHILRRLVTLDALLTNEYNGVNVNIGDYRLTHGCKLMKALKQLNNTLHFMDEEEFEEFRICQSMCTNTAILNGKLCLSIHPLDYMTMSDNACDWSSCMSWQESGCYRMGTVEMMNSPYVIVAYLESSHPMYFNRETSWNNKKWRSLYIVTPDIVTNVKAYPYYDGSIDKIVTNWLYELMVKAFPNYNYEKPYTFEYPMIGSTRLRFETNLMYNDFGCGVNHWGFRRKGVGDNLIVNYSGDAQCMVCGNTNSGSLYEDCLICNVCEPRDDIWYCEECGCRLTEDEVYFINGSDVPLCECCYQKCAARDCISDEDGWCDEMIPVIYMPASLIDHSCQVAKAYLDEYIRLRKMDNIKQLYLAPHEYGMNWSVEDAEEANRRQQIYNFMIAHSGCSFDEICDLWENYGRRYEMARFLQCWADIAKCYTNNNGADLGPSSAEGVTMKSIYLYKGYLVVNTAAMDHDLEEACRNAFFYTDRFVYAHKILNNDTSNNPSVYDWFKDSGLLNATAWHDFDF